MKPKPCGQMTPINTSLNSTNKIFEKSGLWRQENLQKKKKVVQLCKVMWNHLFSCQHQLKKLQIKWEVFQDTQTSALLLLTAYVRNASTHSVSHSHSHSRSVQQEQHQWKPCGLNELSLIKRSLGAAPSSTSSTSPVSRAADCCSKTPPCGSRISTH